MRAPAFLLAAAMLAGVPAAAQSGDESDLLRTARAIGDATAGAPVGNGRGDKVVYLGRNGGGYVVVSIAGLVPGAAAGAPPDGSAAIILTRASAANGNQAPIASDVALARSTGIPLFVVGEWRAPPVIWELIRQGDGVRLREVDAEGRAGPWRTAAR